MIYRYKDIIENYFRKITSNAKAELISDSRAVVEVDDEMMILMMMMMMDR